MADDEPVGGWGVRGPVRPLPKNWNRYHQVQSAARSVLNALPGEIRPDSTEASIASICVELLAQQGVFETWYYSVPALVLLGNRSRLSVSGRDYRPGNDPVGETNLVTIDLSPLVGSTWGDLARSFAVESGVVVGVPQGREFQEGLEAQRVLHDRFCTIAGPDKSFAEVFRSMNNAITVLGFLNLDFLGNVGHSIVERREDRVYFEAGNSRRLGDVEFFTFEPHIGRPHGRWGFKHENIYFFDGAGKVCEL